MPRAKKSPAPQTVPAAAELTPLEAFALSKAVAPAALKALRPRLQAADGQQVDFRVRIHGAVNVASDASATSIESAGADKVLAAVLARVRTKAARDALLAGVRSDFDAFRRKGELPFLPDEVIDLADDLIASASRKVNKPKTGAISGALSVELLKRS